MKKFLDTVEVNRITITGLQLTTEQAELIRNKVEGELQNILERQKCCIPYVGKKSKLSSSIQLNEPLIDSQLSSGLSQRIAQSIHNVLMME